MSGMGNWRRWVRPGLVATVVLAILAFFLHSGAVERDLKSRVEAELAAGGQGWATADVSGRNVAIRGRAPAPESQRIAVQSATQVLGVRVVTDASDLLPIASPYVWTARKAGRSVTLLGSVPSEAFRNSVLAAARRALPAAEIHDETKLARGAPNGFNVDTAFALSRLAGLAEGTAMLTDATLSVTGVAADAAAYQAARKAFSAERPGTVTLGPVDLLPPRADPFVWSANFDGESVSLAGYVPNEVVHETLVATTKATLSGVPILDRMEIASGEPDGFAEAASFAITTLDRFSKGGVTLDGLSLDVAGVAKSVDDYEAVLAGLTGELPPGLKVVSNTVTPATVSPYGWQGEKTGASVVLTGYLPTAEGRAAIAALAEQLFAGATVTNRIRVAAGEPKIDWLGAIKFAMTELAELGHGHVALGDGSFAIDGEAATSEAFVDIVATTAQKLPASLTLATADVAPPRMSPYRFVAEWGAGDLTLAGYVASDDDRRAILAAAARKFGTAPIVDKLVFASGAPAGFVPAVGVALQAVSRLAGGRAEIVDTAMKIGGGVFYPVAEEEITDTATSALPAGFTADISLTTRQDDQPASPERCRDLLQGVLQTGRIAFDGNKAEIAPDGFGLLDRVAATLARCPDAKIQIGAHSDSEGSSSRNRDRTQARAEAIVDYLVTAGVQRERLTPVGFGESKPVGDNATPEGKAANQRIEFTVELSDGG
jgi:OOP family OmpA-OmpF porin